MRPESALAKPPPVDVTMDGMSRSDRATFRLPAVALFVPVLLFVTASPRWRPSAGGGLLFVVPVVAVAWVLITQDHGDRDRVTAHGLRRFPADGLDRSGPVGVQRTRGGRLRSADRWPTAAAADGAPARTCPGLGRGRPVAVSAARRLRGRRVADGRNRQPSGRPAASRRHRRAPDGRPGARPTRRRPMGRRAQVIALFGGTARRAPAPYADARDEPTRDRAAPAMRPQPHVSPAIERIGARTC